MDIIAEIKKDVQKTWKTALKPYENFQKGAVKEGAMFGIAILIDVSKGNGIKGALFAVPFILVIILGFFAAAQALVSPFF